MPGRTISRRDFVKSTALSAGALAAAGPLAARENRGDRQRPNVVYIMSDQQHWQAMGSVDPFFDTPHLDAFAGDAARFERAFCTTPQCSPSRSSMLTGLYPSKTGVMGNIGAAGGESLAARTLGAMLHEAGYHTGYFGKWHLGDLPAGNAGWDEESRRQNDPAVTDHAVEFIKSRATRPETPFGLVVSYLDPHDVYHFDPDRDKASRDVPLGQSWHRETFQGKPAVQKQFMTRDQGRKLWGHPPEAWEAYRDFYRRKVRLYDQQVGRVLESIRQAGLWEKTIIFIGSDHGDMDTRHKLIFKGPFMYEQMVRVPFMARVPKQIGGSRRGLIRDFDTVNVDLVPTIRDFAGLEPIATDGLSLEPLLTGAASVPKRDYVIGQYYGKQQWVNPIRMIRTDRFKYNRYIENGEELYDLLDDPDEIVNLAGDRGRAKVKEELAGELDAWIRANHDPFYSLKTSRLEKRFEAPGPGDRRLS
jgi:arylsulfatase A-like enzyme